MFMLLCYEYHLFYPNMQRTMNIIGFIHAASTYLFLQQSLQLTPQKAYQQRCLHINENIGTVAFLHIIAIDPFINNISLPTRKIDAFHVLYRFKEGCTLGRQHGLKNSCRCYQLRPASGIGFTQKASSAHLKADARQSAIYREG